MVIEQVVIEKLRALPAERQQEVLDFVEFLHRKSAPIRRHRRLKGLWADLKINITAADIAEARREMWGNFPRDIEL
ncbi:MAG: DUF2281 domain-containing protein [Chloroflexota bacterium]